MVVFHRPFWEPSEVTVYRTDLPPVQGINQFIIGAALTKALGLLDIKL